MPNKRPVLETRLPRMGGALISLRNLSGSALIRLVESLSTRRRRGRRGLRRELSKLRHYQIVGGALISPLRKLGDLCGSALIMLVELLSPSLDRA